MNLRLAPECRLIHIPNSMGLADVVEWLDKTDLRLQSYGGVLWAVPYYDHPRTRVGDLIASIQLHPQLRNKHTYSSLGGYVSYGEDDRYIYSMVVTEK